jgi:hypothetical protein
MARARLVIVAVGALAVLFLSAASVYAQELDPDHGPSSARAPKDFEKGEAGSFIRQRWDWFYKQRAYPLKRIPPGARLRSLQQLDAKLAEEAAARARQPRDGNDNRLPASSGSWQLIGPQPLNGFWGPNSGRVAAVAVDPTNNQVVYSGAAQGGVWKTTDGGNTWAELTDQQASLAIGSIAIDPENHNTVYVGTGEENNSGDSYYGAGILKSTDGGNTWTNYPGPFAGGSGGGARIGGLAVHPSNSNIVLAAVGCCGPQGWGIFQSTDGGMTWTSVFNNGSQAYNVIFNPTNGNIAYASVDGNGVYVSTNAGATWSPDNGSGANSLPISGTGRVALAMDPNNSSTLYAGIANASTGGIWGLYQTTNGGATWTQLTNAPNYCGGQCWYDNAIAVQPGNSDVIYAGGDANPTWRSLDGGNTWTNISTIHPDTHAFIFTPDGTILYTGTDGGMWSTTQITATTPVWTDLNAGLATIQYYSGPSIDPANANAGYAGTQDNSTEQYNGSLTWNSVDCGDGGPTVIDFTNPNTAYVNCIQISLDKTTDNGASFTSMLNGINPNDNHQWVPPLTMDPNNAQNLYFGTQYVYQTTDGAGLWTAISPDLSGGNGNSLTAIAVSPVNSNTVYTASSDDYLYVSTNALSGSSATWTNISGTSATLPPRFMTALAADPHSSTTAYVVFSGFSGYSDNLGHVFETTNGGSSWVDISGDLPNTPVNAIVVDPLLANTIYVGTDVGVFYTTNGGTSWAPLVTGLPRVAVLGMAYQAATQTLWAATHGRSMWATNVTAVTALPGVTSLSPSSALLDGPTFTLTVNGGAFNSSSVVQWNGNDLTTTFSSSTRLTAQVPASDLTAAGTAQVTVLNPGSQGEVSNPVTFTINNPVPSAASLSPSTVVAGSGGFTLTVNGSNFVSGSTVLWNGSSRVTAFVNSSQVTAAILASDVSTGGTASVTVSNPGPGGGISNALTFTIGNPVPALTTLSPSSKTEGSPTFTLTVSGTNFVSGAAVNWNGSPLTTTFDSSTTVKASISASLIASAGTVPVTVTNPGPGGGTSNALTFTINNPRPTITSISPPSATAGGPGFTLTVAGTNFVPTSTVDWNGSTRTTTFVNGSKVTATILASDIATAGTDKVTVVNPGPGGGTSASSTFTVNNPVPSITSISPSSGVAGGPQFTLTVNGSNFVSGSEVEWNGARLTTAFVSSIEVTATVPSNDIKTAGTASVTVFNSTPGGGTSNTKTFTIDNAVPTISSISPSTATIGGAGFTLTVNGTNFISGTTVQWNGSSRTTTFVNATKVTAAILAGDISRAGTANVTASNPAPGGGTSNAATFTIYPHPTITSLSPPSATAGGPTFTLTVNGTGFNSPATVQWNGSNLQTTFVSSTELTATVPGNDISTAGTASIVVNDPTSEGGASSPASYPINNPVPGITRLNPSSATAGGPAFTLTVTGSNFVSTSVVNWNGSQVSTTFVGKTSLQATIPASDISQAGTAQVTVSNPAPGGGTSNALTFTINP